VCRRNFGTNAQARLSEVAAVWDGLASSPWASDNAGLQRVWDCENQLETEQGPK